MANQPLNITTPVGRMVMGNLYVGDKEDAEGKPLVYKRGANTGRPRENFFFAVAIPKAPGETHWAYSEWGAKIWAFGHQAFPQAAQSPQFAWKIEDGDSAIPNKRGRKNVETEGFAGHWILKFSGGYAPVVYVAQNGNWVQEPTPNYVKPGYFVEVSFSVDSNESQQQPGIYLNHRMVAFRAYGPEIVFGPNVDEAGFGAAPLPAGASTVPLGGAPLPSVPAGAVAPLAPAGAALPPVPGVASPAPAAPAIGATNVSHSNIPVVPNPGFAQVPAPAATQAIPAAPPAKQMTAAATGIPYEQWITKGWTDAQLIANGYMLA